MIKLKNVKSVTKDGALFCIECETEKLLPKGIKHSFRTCYINSQGKLVANFKSNNVNWVELLSDNYDNIFVINDHFREKETIKIVKIENGKQILINQHLYDDIEYGIEDGCFGVKRNNLWGYINDLSEEIISCQYEDYCYFSEGLAAVCKNGKWGFINKKNEIIIPFIYDTVENFSSFTNGLAIVKKDAKVGLINKNGDIVVPFIYDNMDSTLSPDLKIWGAKLNGKWGFIDRDGNEILPFIYDEVEGTEDETYLVKINGKQGTVDGIRQIQTTPCQYDEIEYYLYFNDSKLAKVKNGDKYGLINKNGELIVPLIYSKIIEHEKGFAVKDNECNSGILNKKGEPIVPLKYSYINEVQDNYFIATTHLGLFGEYGLYDFNENLIYKSEEKIYGINNEIVLIPEQQLNGERVFKLCKLESLKRY